MAPATAHRARGSPPGSLACRTVCRPGRREPAAHARGDHPRGPGLGHSVPHHGATDSPAARRAHGPGHRRPLGGRRRRGQPRPCDPGLVGTYRDRLPLHVVVRASTRPASPRPRSGTGFAAASGRVLIRCDDDLTPAPDMVRRHLAHHRSADRPIGVMGATRDLLPETPYARAYGGPPRRAPWPPAYARPPSALAGLGRTHR